MTQPTAYSNRHIQGEIPAADRDLLFDAVAWRLRIIASETMSAPVQAAIEDCVQALEQLHASRVPRPYRVQPMQQNADAHRQLSGVLTVARPANGQANAPAGHTGLVALH